VLRLPHPNSCEILYAVFKFRLVALRYDVGLASLTALQAFDDLVANTIDCLRELPVKERRSALEDDDLAVGEPVRIRCGHVRNCRALP
jgi:hypothetical protein